jgi:RimJ/RimL family protein N-acetyltransferase
LNGDINNRVLHGERIDLLPQLAEHADEMFGILSAEGLYKHTGGEPPLDIEQLRQRFSMLESRCSPDGSQLWLNWVIRLNSEACLVGYSQATVTNDAADLAWVIGEQWQGQGYATEATKLLVDELLAADVSKLTAHIPRGHEASRSVARKVSMQNTGRMDQAEELWQLGEAL